MQNRLADIGGYARQFLTKNGFTGAMPSLETSETHMLIDVVFPEPAHRVPIGSSVLRMPPHGAHRVVQAALLNDSKIRTLINIELDTYVVGDVSAALEKLDALCEQAHAHKKILDGGPGDDVCDRFENDFRPFVLEVQQSVNELFASDAAFNARLLNIFAETPPREGMWERRFGTSVVRQLVELRDDLRTFSNNRRTA